MVPQCKHFPQNVTSLPKRAKIVIPHKATEKFVPQHTERGWREGERPLSTLSLSYKAVYPGFPTGVANIKILSKNNCEGVHFIVRLPDISLQASKFTKNEPLHTYFLRILARF